MKKYIRSSGVNTLFFQLQRTSFGKIKVVFIKDFVFVLAMDIKNKIYTIRRMQVMLDKDIAELYEIKPIRLREQVKRNMERYVHLLRAFGTL